MSCEGPTSPKADPLDLVRYLLGEAGADFDRYARAAWHHKGIGPNQLLAMTPNQLYFLLTGHAAGTGDRQILDPLALLTETNRRRATEGKGPVVPRWFLPGLRGRQATPPRPTTP